MTTQAMAGDAEAAGAVAGMVEVYGRPLPEIGQWVTGVAAGRRFSGTVASSEPGRVGVRVDEYTSLVVRPSDID